MPPPNGAYKISTSSLDYVVIMERTQQANFWKPCWEPSGDANARKSLQRKNGRMHMNRRRRATTSVIKRHSCRLPQSLGQLLLGWDLIWTQVWVGLWWVRKRGPLEREEQALQLRCLLQRVWRWQRRCWIVELAVSKRYVLNRTRFSWSGL